MFSHFMVNPAIAHKPKIFYGYYIILVSFLCFFIFSGAGFFSFSLFVTSLQKEFNWSRGGIMLAFTIFFLILALSSPVIGKVFDKYGAKKVIVGGGMITTIGFILLSQVNNLLTFYIYYAIVGVGISSLGQIPASAVVSNWFRQKRGLAIGIAAAGAGVGGIVLAPIIGGYVIPAFGWRAAYLTLGAISFIVVVPISIVLLKTRPSEMGLRPDGASEAAEIKAQTYKRGLTLRESLHTPAFWLISISFLLSQFSLVGVMQTQVPYLQDTGFPVVQASGALGFVGLGTTIGKLLFGWLCDRIKPKYVCAIGLGLQVTAIFILMNVKVSTPLVLIWGYAVTMGLGASSWLPTMSMLTSTCFGLAAYGAIFGMVSLVQNIGAAIGPLFAGSLFDLMKTYQTAFAIFLALYVIAVPAILLVRQPGPKKTN